MCVCTCVHAGMCLHRWLCVCVHVCMQACVCIGGCVCGMHSSGLHLAGDFFSISKYSILLPSPNEGVCNMFTQAKLSKRRQMLLLHLPHFDI